MLQFARYLGLDHSGAQTPTSSLPVLDALEATLTTARTTSEKLFAATVAALYTRVCLQNQ